MSMMTINETTALPVEQRSAAWYEQRRGKVTASRVNAIVATTKAGGWTAARDNYMTELLAERLTGETVPVYETEAMRWGSGCEEQARAAYEFMHDAMIEPAGFVDHPVVDLAGASPDGYVGDDGLVEIKCLLTKNHLAALLSGKVPEEYLPQMQFQMACTGRKWVDWVSFDPRLPPGMQMFVKRIERDDDAIAKLETKVVAFLNELADKVAYLNKQFVTLMED